MKQQTATTAKPHGAHHITTAWKARRRMYRGPEMHLDKFSYYFSYFSFTALIFFITSYVYRAKTSSHDHQYPHGAAMSQRLEKGLEMRLHLKPQVSFFFFHFQVLTALFFYLF
jgi:hypothetical protein